MLKHFIPNHWGKQRYNISMLYKVFTITSNIVFISCKVKTDLCNLGVIMFLQLHFDEGYDIEIDVSLDFDV